MPAHFAHIVGTCSASEPESQQHLLGKRWLQEWLSGRAEVAELEVYYPEIQQRADVVVTSRQPPLVLEFQCSPISVGDLARRTAGYHQLRLNVIWIMGRRYFGSHFGPKQYKFMADDLALWFLDSSRGILSHHQWQKQGWQTTHFTKAASRFRTRRFFDQAQQEQRQLESRLYYRDHTLLALQAVAYKQGHHLAGVPWEVHWAQTHLPGLPQPEWLMRAHWLLYFDNQPMTAAADLAFWNQYLALNAPLRHQAPVLEAVSHRWQQVLVAGGYLSGDGQWQRSLSWFPDGVHKRQAWAQARFQAN
ncbi:competence protein [Lacticaseibacillus brantae DSM 23927]|uniref:Competence protein n=2 Tax=Lacticaseibacillus brantae TaxID=943673 RepID=A0A0R2AYY8_9LACO|nr:competence protein [Lacticaseibacillus brantae DSM 23927]